jgi:hypothetical protein
MRALKNHCAAVLTLAFLIVSAVASAQWVELSPADAPSARYGHTMTTVAGEVYLFAGNGSSGVRYNDLWKWDRDQQTWVELTPMGNPPPARFYHGAVSVNGKLYIGFGIGSAVTHGDLWEYDPVADTWTELTVAGGPVPHFLGGMAALPDGRIFVAGGYNESDQVIGDAYIIDLGPGSKGGITVQTLMPLPRGLYGQTTGSTPCGMPMVIGGWAAKDGYTNEILVWDPDPAPSGSWVPMVPGGVPALARVLAATVQLFHPHKAGEWGEDIWIIGGESGDKAAATMSTQVFNISSNNWSYGDDMMMALASTAAAALPPRASGTGHVEILLFGGQTNVGDAVGWTFLYTSKVEVVTGTISYVAATAHAAGVGGTMWTTDLEAHNWGDEDTDITIDLLAKDTDNNSPASTTVTLSSGQSQRWTDVLDTLFSFSGSAALRLRTMGDVLVTSRTYTPNPDAVVGGTYGQFIPTAADSDAIDNGEEAYLIQLTRSSDPSLGFRTNIGFVNLTDTSIDIEVDLYDSTGTLLGTEPKNRLEPFGFTQINDIFNRVGAADVSDGYAVVRTTTVAGRFLTYASVVDNITGDPVFISPLDAITGGNEGYITAAAHAPGVGSSVWRSDLQLFNSGDTTVTGLVDLLLRDQDNSSRSAELFTLNPGLSQRWEDVLGTYFSVSNDIAALHVSVDVDTGSVMINSRTFNDQQADGTYGQYIPIVAGSDAVSFDEEARLIQLTRSAGYRTNIGLVNTSGLTVEMEIDLYQADGTYLGKRTRTLDLWGYHQVNDIFDKVAPGVVVNDGFAVVRTTTAGGRFFTYASVVDNATSDPVYVPGQK